MVRAPLKHHLMVCGESSLTRRRTQRARGHPGGGRVPDARTHSAERAALPGVECSLYSVNKTLLDAI